MTSRDLPPRPVRIHGLDYARALAIIGMIGAHAGDVPEFWLTEPSTWLGVIHGNPSILFGLLAGVSIAIMTGRTRIPEPHEMPTLRLRLVGRGAVIFGVGLVLEALGTVVAIILTFYGLLYLLVLPFLRLRPRTLVIIAAGIGLAGPSLGMCLMYLGGLTYAPGLNFLIGGMYPLTTWLPLLLLGLAIGRGDITRITNALAMAVLGFGVWLLAQGVGVLAFDLIYDLESAGDPDSASAIVVRALLDITAHSGSTIELIASAGFAFGVLGVCLCLPAALAPVLRPLGALGAMPLTSYSAHILSLALLWPGAQLPLSNLAWFVTVVVLLIACPLYLGRFDRGPLEALAGRVGRRTISQASSALRAVTPPPSPRCVHFSSTSTATYSRSTAEGK
jgi:uncharacterized membrane protein YeiB